MSFLSALPKARCLLTNLARIPQYNCIASNGIVVRQYAKGKGKSKRTDACDGCRRALADIPDPGDPECPLPCEARRKKKKKGLLYKFKMRFVEGGANFGTPFKFLQPKKQICEKEKKEKKKPKALPAPSKEVLSVPDPRPGVQVSILGADTAVGQYVALLLKQCSCIKKLRLYEATDTTNSECNRDMYKVVQDLQHIDTNCLVQAFSCHCYDLELCLQNTDIVLMLESDYANVNMPVDKRFATQAPIVKRYADAIAHECPKAFVIVCATPVECMVPLVAETFKETGWYDRRKLLGSMAVPEMRASTLAARALCLEPRVTRVPCVGGSEGEALVPLFSRAVEYFDFARYNAEMMTDTVRAASMAVSRCECACLRNAALSEAHALAGLVKSVAHALLCQDIPRVSGFVETDAGQVISPARFIANKVDINGSGIWTNHGLPLLTETELRQVSMAMLDLDCKLRMVYDWYCRYRSSTTRLDAMKKDWFKPKNYKRFDDCAYACVSG